MVTDADDLPFWFEEREGATLGEIEAAERHVGHALPDAFRQLLMKQNGGVSNFAGCEIGDRYFPILPIFGVDAQAAAGTIMRAFDVRRTFGVPDDVVVFAGQGNAWWGLDYREDSVTPSVIYRDDPDQPIETVAPRFEDFLANLTED